MIDMGRKLLVFGLERGGRNSLIRAARNQNFTFSSLKFMDEIIDLHSDQYFMGEALRQARRAWEQEEVPVGAVIVRDGRIIARAGNQVETLKDATAHAEMLAITQAESVVGEWRLTDCDLYVTKEPCSMCAGALVHV